MNSAEKSLYNGDVNTEYTIKAIMTDGDDELKKFLFSLGCYEGEKITIISMLHQNFVINVKDARYSIDADLARAILI